MRRLKDWLTRPDSATDTQRALVALLLVLFGGMIGVFLSVFSVVTHSLSGVLQGVAIMILAIGVWVQGPRR